MSDETEDQLQPDKTPISNLQEWCTRHGITPQYDLVANEGAIHEPLFVFKVTAGDCICTGKGPSKKKAKHNAAVAALSQLLGISPNSAAAGLMSDKPGADSTQIARGAGGGVSGVGLADDGQAGNPVGELQETTQKRMWPPPSYEFASEQGPPHAREFVCIVRLFNITEQAVGKSKKLAKRNAAVAMLQLIKQGVVTPKINNDRLVDNTDNDDEAQPHDLDMTSSLYMPSDPRNDRRSTTTGAMPSVQLERKKTSAMFQPCKASRQRGRLLESLQDLSLNPNEITSGAEEEHCKKLAALAQEQSVQVEYVDLRGNVKNVGESDKRRYLCMSRLSTVPVIVCYGMGSTRSRAHAVAAINTLNTLKVLTKKT